jgi:hypothetical protein
MPADSDLVASCSAVKVDTELVTKFVATDIDGGWNGASRTRTGDLLRATQALSLLSYSPGKPEVICQINASLLAVARRGEPQMDTPPSGYKRARQKVAAVELCAIHRDEVDLIDVVIAALVTVGGTPRTRQIDLDDSRSLVECTPLALNAEMRPSISKARS